MVHKNTGKLNKCKKHETYFLFDESQYDSKYEQITKTACVITLCKTEICRRLGQITNSEMDFFHKQIIISFRREKKTHFHRS